LKRKTFEHKKECLFTTSTKDVQQEKRRKKIDRGGLVVVVVVVGMADADVAADDVWLPR
jgi:hypothetical protein